MPRSQTPVGFLNTRHNAFRASAFRPLHAVGFSGHFAMTVYLMTTIILISRLNHAAYILDPLSFALPLPVQHVRFSTDLPAGL